MTRRADWWCYISILPTITEFGFWSVDYRLFIQQKDWCFESSSLIRCTQCKQVTRNTAKVILRSITSTLPGDLSVFFCLFDFTNQINVTLNLLKKSLPLIIQHEALICQNLSFISIYCTSIWSCNNVIWRFRGVEDKNNDWLWQFRWIDILINHRTKSAAITFSFNLCTYFKFGKQTKP